MNKVITAYSCFVAFILVASALCLDLLIKKHRWLCVLGNSCAKKMSADGFVEWMCCLEWGMIVLGVVIGYKMGLLKTNKLLWYLFCAMLGLFIILQIVVV